MKLKIGNVTLENNLVLAPMAGVTDLPFRLLCREQGAGLICTEMVSAKAIYYKNKNTESLMKIHEKERPVSLQLFGSEPDLMAEIARQIEERNFDILDINMGCPVPKVVNNGEGSALMKNPRLVHEIIYKVSRAIKCQDPERIYRGHSQCGGDRQDRRRRRGRSYRCPWKDQRTVLFRTGGLEHHTPGKGSSLHSRHRKRRCGFSPEGRSHDPGNRLRRHYDRPGRPGQSLAVFQDPPLSGNRGTSSSAG